jgi:hypothetical protein
MPIEAGDVVMVGQAEWLPNTIGFNDLRNFQMIEPIPAVVVVGSAALVFSQWDLGTKKYSVMREVKYDSMTEARIDMMGSSARVVVRSADFSYNTFSFLKAGGNLVDSEKSKEAGHYLAERISSGGE